MFEPELNQKSYQLFSPIGIVVQLKSLPTKSHFKCNERSFGYIGE
jgi:hypothetical protein